MDSHIIIPKRAYKEFVNEKNFYHMYDVKNEKIIVGRPKKTFTEEGYYSLGIEKKLNKYVETLLGKLLAFCRNVLMEDMDNIVVSDKVKNVAWIYFQSLWARNPKMCELISKNSVYYQFMSSQSQHDVAVDVMMDESKKRILMQILDFSFLINKTDVQFVLPTRGIYEHLINGVTCYSIPINPYVCLHFREKGKVIHEGDMIESYLLIEKEMSEFVRKLNEFAFIKQKNDGLGYVVCRDKTILEDLKYKTEQNALIDVNNNARRHTIEGVVSKNHEV